MKKKKKKKSLALNSHENNFFNIIKNFKFDLTILNKDVFIEINNIHYTFYIFIIIFIKNIK